MNYKVRILDEALAEVQEAMKWYGEVSVELSNDVETKFFESIDKLVKYPLTHPKTKANVRKYRMDRFPYNLLYRVNKNLIVIIALVHHRRKPNYWKGRKS